LITGLHKKYGAVPANTVLPAPPGEPEKIEETIEPVLLDEPLLPYMCLDFAKSELDGSEPSWAANEAYDYYSTMYFCAWMDDKWMHAEGRSSGESEACYMAEMTMEQYRCEGEVPHYTKEDTAEMGYDEKKKELLDGIGYYQECELYQHHVENHPYDDWPEYIVEKIFDSDAYNRAWGEGYDEEFVATMQKEINWEENARLIYVAALFNRFGLATCGLTALTDRKDSLVGRKVVVKRAKGVDCTGSVLGYNKHTGRHRVEYEDDAIYSVDGWQHPGTYLCTMSKYQYRVLPKLKLHPILCQVMDLAAPITCCSDSETEFGSDSDSS
jgi:hypothetical protein